MSKTTFVILVAIILWTLCLPLHFLIRRRKKELICWRGGAPMSSLSQICFSLTPVFFAVSLLVSAYKKIPTSSAYLFFAMFAGIFVGAIYDQWKWYQQTKSKLKTGDKILLSLFVIFVGSVLIVPHYLGSWLIVVFVGLVLAVYFYGHKKIWQLRFKKWL